MCSNPEPWITSGRHVSSESKSSQTTNMADTSTQTIPGLPGWILHIKDGKCKNSENINHYVSNTDENTVQIKGMHSVEDLF